MIGSRRIVMAVGPNGFAAAHVRRGSLDGPVFQFSRLVPDDELDWLSEGVAQAAAALNLSDETVDILVLRSFSFGKIVDLPPVRSGLLRSLVETNLERLFPVRAEIWSADAVPIVVRRQPGLRSTVAASLPCALLDHVELVVRDAGLKLGRVIPAPAGAAAFATELAKRGDCPTDGLLELSLPYITELVSLQGGRPISLVPAAGPVDETLEALETAGLTCLPRFGPIATGWRLALEICAVSGCQRSVAQPMSANLLRRRRSESRRRSIALMGATAIALFMGFGFRVLDLKRELAAVRDARSEIAPMVERALDQRENLTQLRDLAVQIEATQQMESRWPALFADIASSMPETAYLTEVVGRPDSLVLWGTQGADGWRSSSVFQVSVPPNATSAGSSKVVVSWQPPIPVSEGQVQDAN